MSQSPLNKFKLLQKRVILIIRCYGILKSYAYDGRSEVQQQEEPQEEEKSSLRDEHGKLPKNCLKRTVKKVIQFMSANNNMSQSFNMKTTFTNDAAIRFLDNLYSS